MREIKKLKYLCYILDEFRQPISAEKRAQNSDVLYDYYGASGAIDKIDGYTIDDHVMLIGEDGANLVLRNLPLMYEVNGKAWINNHAHILKPKENIDFDYLFFALENADIFPFVTGSAQPKLNQENLKLIPIPITDYNTQKLISSFIKEKNSEINLLVSDIQSQIEALEEYKRSVITEAVTKGLDPDVEMRDSGVEWVEFLPKHWSETRIGYSAWLRARLGWKGLKADEYTEEGYPFLSAFNIVDSLLSWDNLNFINEERYLESPEIMLNIGDIILVKDGAGIGKCARIDELPFGASTTNGSLAVITTSKDLNYKYLYYYFLSAYFQNYIQRIMNGMGVPHLSQEELRKIVIPLPPVSEQNEIAEHLDNKCNDIQSAINNKKQQIETIEEYKKSLIFEYVTGKKEVQA